MPTKTGWCTDMDPVFKSTVAQVAQKLYYSGMAREIKLRRSGGSLTATLPKDIVEHFHLEEGDRAFIVETPEGILITPYDPEFAQALKVYRRGARKYRDAFRELAK